MATAPKCTSPVVAAEAVRQDAILDCEVICTDEQGRADFGQLHSRRDDDEAIACAFDLLKLDGEDLRAGPSPNARPRCRGCWPARGATFNM